MERRCGLIGRLIDTHGDSKCPETNPEGFFVGETCGARLDRHIQELVTKIIDE